MDLVYSVALLGLAVILFISFMLGDRNPDRPGWASEGVANDLSSVAIAGLIAFGTCYAFKFGMTIAEQTMGLKVFILLAVTLISYYLILRALAPRRRLAEYAREHARRNNMDEPPQATVVQIAAAGGNNDPSSGPTLPRAA